MSKKSEAQDLLREHEDDLLYIKERFYFLEAFQKVLAERTKGHTFEMHNNTVYRCAYDCYDMLAIDLASLCRGMVGKGGFFNQLNNHLAEMKLKKEKEVEHPKGSIHYAGEQPSEERKREIEESIRQDFAISYLKANAEAFYRLFPLAKDRSDKKISQADVKALKDRFFAMAEELIEDRDGNRAHRYESPKRNRAAKEKVPMLSVKKIGHVFENIEGILNDIRLICSDSTFHYADMNNCTVETTSKDLIDLVLLGTTVQVNHFFGVDGRLRKHEQQSFSKLREQYYKVWHEDFERRYTEGNAKKVEKYREHGDYNQLQIPDLPINKFLPEPI